MESKDILFELLAYKIKEGGYIDISLLEKIKDINFQNKDGYTLLHVCAFTNNYNFAKILLDLGANPNIPDVNGRTPLHHAAEECNKEVLKLLLSRKDVDKYKLTINREDILHLIYENQNHKWIDSIVCEYREINDYSSRKVSDITIFQEMLMSSIYNPFVLSAILYENNKNIIYKYKKDKDYVRKKRMIVENILVDDYGIAIAIVYNKLDAIKDFVEYIIKYTIDLNKIEESIESYFSKYNKKPEQYKQDFSYKFYKFCLNQYGL